MASKKVEKRYGNSPKVKPKATGSTGDVGSASPSKTTPGATPEASVMSGTDGITVGDRQGVERTALTDGHLNEMKDMHKRHASAVSEMTARHMAELGMGAPAKEKG